MNSAVTQKFDAYPNNVREQLLAVRETIFALAAEEGIGEITETLKWGEPSYLAKKGSTVRMDWKPDNGDSISLYFHCQTLLVETFREIFPERFDYIGNRELRLPLSETVPSAELKTCLSMALRYHRIKHLPLLGLL